MTAVINITNQVFGRLTVTGRHGSNDQGLATWSCNCSCGEVVIAISSGLRKGNIKSCGCLRKEKFLLRTITHGMTGSIEYTTWQHMKDRCTNQKSTGYENYGGRGIKVCDRWMNSFENFYADMGDKPKHLSIDRIDNDGNYQPENCRWATHKQQMRNQRIQKNNKTGIRGVQADHPNYWRAVISIDGKRKHLYYGRSFQTAVEARESAELKYWGNHG